MVPKAVLGRRIHADMEKRAAPHWKMSFKMFPALMPNTTTNVSLRARAESTIQNCDHNCMQKEARISTEKH